MAKEEDSLIKLNDLMIHLREEFDQWADEKKSDKHFASLMQYYLDEMFRITDENILYRKVEKKEK